MSAFTFWLAHTRVSERIVVLFDGRDESAVAQARLEWKRARAAGCEVTYWQQDEDGRWAKRA